MKEKKAVRVLVVDDSALNLKLLKSLLLSQGYEVVTAAEGKSTRQLLSQEEFDLALLDIHLPDDNGVDICRIIKADPKTADMPVVFISAMDSVDDKILGFEAGGSDYVTKPFHKEEVLVRVKTQLTILELQKKLKSKIQELEGLYKEVKELSLRDGLTGLYNRRYLNEALAYQVNNAKRYRKCLSVIIGDVDHFKQVNDRFSHQVGDEVLKRVGTIIARSVRESDTASRYGGEEFFVSLPETGKEKAVQVAERIRQAIEVEPWQEVHPELRITISLGLASLETPEQWDSVDLNQLLSRADEKLYEAKHAGRNQVRF